MRVTAKFGKMRKPANWYIYPMHEGRITVQADGRIGQFDAETGEGVINMKGEYFPHLDPKAGAVPFTFPPEFVTECKAMLAADAQKFDQRGPVIFK
jgi:hypothetical protein